MNISECIYLIVYERHVFQVKFTVDRGEPDLGSTAIKWASTTNLTTYTTSTAHLVPGNRH